ncbi:hypothetical protein PHYBOEH_008862 [Phytophthora boehmeriae]|uniref:Uncharacterized protein n=1 Tax=Phytophthora boehmeriae TaxID=109152 RepID=A0A8T1W1F4_9STRA|nr:hypothetical protein PHYBOEH_008862 [Phytophthora boehmeriae]
MFFVFLSTACEGGVMILNHGITMEDPWRFELTDTTRRCYYFTNCFNDRASLASWQDVNALHIVFYKDKYCTGEYVAASTPTDSLFFYKYNLANEVSSFMLWGDLYDTPTGYIDACAATKEKIAAKATNISVSLTNKLH